MIQLYRDTVYSISRCVTAPPKVQSVPKQTILGVMIESMTWETNPTVFGLTLLRGLNTSQQTYHDGFMADSQNTAGNSSY